MKDCMIRLKRTLSWDYSVKLIHLKLVFGCQKHNYVKWKTYFQLTVPSHERTVVSCEITSFLTQDTKQYNWRPVFFCSVRIYPKKKDRRERRRQNKISRWNEWLDAPKAIFIFAYFSRVLSILKLTIKTNNPVFDFSFSLKNTSWFL